MTIEAEDSFSCDVIAIGWSWFSLNRSHLLFVVDDDDETPWNSAVFI